MKINYTKKKTESKLTIEPILNKELSKTKHKELLESIGFKAEDGSCQLLPESGLLYIGIEKRETQALQISASGLAKTLKAYEYQSALFDVSSFKDEEVKALAVGVLLGAYEFNQYKSEAKNSTFETLEFYSQTNLEDVIKEAHIIADATNFTRDIVNKTPEELYPLALAELASNLAQNNGLSIDIIDESALLDEGMQAMYMVGRASQHRSQLIHLSYKPKNAKKTITLVGKGLTYDSGGLSLKPADSMVTMKLDKAGASAVLGIIKAASELKLPFEIHGFIGAVENMLGGNAYKPDDVLKAKNGTTIEVRNTDAEGRLVLADVLCYAQEKVKADYVFDYATLTGACVVALGLYTTGIMGHSTKLKHQISKANTPSGELSASLPFNDFLKKELKSDVADIKNVTGRWGGAITAGLFLDHFIKEENKQKWLHFDIAGPAFTEKPWGVNPYGGTGAGVRLTIEWLKSLL